MVVAAGDHLTPSDLALEAYSRALEPKRLELLPGGHFDAYLGQGFEQATGGPATGLCSICKQVGLRHPPWSLPEGRVLHDGAHGRHCAALPGWRGARE